MSMRLRAAGSLLAALLTTSTAAAGEVPLADAAARGDLAAVRALIAQKADINAARLDGTTALHAAIHADRLDIADILLRARANAGARDRYGITPLYLATVNGNAAM